MTQFSFLLIKSNLTILCTALDTDQSPEKKEACKRATDSLIRSVDSLVRYAGQPEFAGVPAKISVKGRVIQEPIVSSGRSVIEGSCNMLTGEHITFNLAKLYANTE